MIVMVSAIILFFSIILGVEGRPFQTRQVQVPYRGSPQKKAHGVPWRCRACWNHEGQVLKYPTRISISSLLWLFYANWLIDLSSGSAARTTRRRVSRPSLVSSNCLCKPFTLSHCPLAVYVSLFSFTHAHPSLVIIILSMHNKTVVVVMSLLVLVLSCFLCFSFCYFQGAAIEQKDQSLSVVFSCPLKNSPKFCTFGTKVMWNIIIDVPRAHFNCTFLSH